MYMTLTKGRKMNSTMIRMCVHLIQFAVGSKNKAYDYHME